MVILSMRVFHLLCLNGWVSRRKVMMKNARIVKISETLTVLSY